MRCNATCAQREDCWIAGLLDLRLCDWRMAETAKKTAAAAVAVMKSLLWPICFTVLEFLRVRWGSWCSFSR